MSALLHLMDADRAEDRSIQGGMPGYAEFRARDARRREQVAAILDRQEALGADELYAAAWILNHGDTPQEALRAHDLARTAAERGHGKARWLSAATLDRSLMYSGKPQRYGTNMVPDGTRYRLWDVDPATTDAERAVWDVPPLAEMERRAADLSAKAPQPPLEDAPQWLKDALRRWKAEAPRD